LKQVKVDDPSLGVVQVTDVTSFDGEAVANNRKAKLIFFYEWNVKGEWKGLRNGDVDEVEGTFEITNLSEENEASEVEVLVSLKENASKVSGAEIMKEMMRKKGAEGIRDKLENYIELLKSDFAKDLIKPTKDTSASGSTTNCVSATQQQARDSLSKLQVNNKNSSDKKDIKVGVKIETKSLCFSEELKARKEEVFRALTQPELVSAFTRGPASVDPVINGKFALFDGNVSGYFTLLKADEEIQQKWRFKSWPPEHYSDVTLTISEKEDHTVVSLKQTGIPSSDFERTERGWRQMYFHAMKQTFGFGSILY